MRVASTLTSLYFVAKIKLLNGWVILRRRPAKDANLNTWGKRTSSSVLLVPSHLSFSSVAESYLRWIHRRKIWPSDLRELLTQSPHNKSLDASGGRGFFN